MSPMSEIVLKSFIAGNTTAYKKWPRYDEFTCWVNETPSEPYDIVRISFTVPSCTDWLILVFQTKGTKKVSHMNKDTSACLFYVVNLRLWQTASTFASTFFRFCCMAMLKAFATPFLPRWNMLNQCWKSLKAFKLCFNIPSTFLLFLECWSGV